MTNRIGNAPARAARTTPATPAAATVATVATARFAALAALAALAGCSSGPPAPRYLLEPAAVARVEAPARARGSLGLETVSVPGYVEDSSVAGRGAGGALRIDTRAQWSEAPETALTRALAESLRLRSGAPVLVEPLPRGFDPEARVEVVFDRLLRAEAGGAELAGQVRLVSGDGRRLLSVRPFELARPGRDGSPDAFFEALSIAVDDLARLVVAALDDAPA